MSEKLQYLNLQHEAVPSFESFSKLFGELIKYYHSTSNLKKNNNNEKTLKKHLYNILFSQRKDKEETQALSELEKLLWYSHLLKKKRKLDDSRNLDNLIKSLKNNNLLEDNGVRNVLQFLTHLTGNEVEKSKSQLSIPSPWISSRHGDSLTLPNHPLCYNDTRLDAAFSRWHYTHFPSNLFKIDDSVLYSTEKKPLLWQNETFDSCNKEPGLNHRFNFFKKDENEIDKSCFGALIGPRRLKSPITPDTPLSIPNLPNIPEGYSFIHTLSYRKKSNNFHSGKTREIENATIDEGYVSSRCSDAGNPYPVKEDIWEEVLKEGNSPERFTWETTIKRANFIPKVKPFAAEGGSQITHRLFTIEQNYISMIDSLSVLPSSFKVSSEELCTQILHILCGIPSSNFYISKEYNIFMVREGLYYEGVTADSLRPHLEDFIRCGNEVLRLEEFCKWSFTQYDGSQENKLSMTSFKRAIKNFILYCREKFLSLTGENKLLGLKLKTEAIRKKIDFVYKICLRGIDNKWFLNSLSLIGELSKELLATRSSNDLFLLLYFFNSACKPFLVFLEKWIYDGEFCDPNLEFMIQVNGDSLTSKTRTYWTKSHTLRSSFIELLPEFLRGVVVTSFECGKSLNLLKICCPQSYLLTKEVSNRPRVSLCSSLNEVLLKRLQCQKYEFEMGDLCKKYVITLSDFDRQMEEKNKFLQNIANNRHGDRLRTFQDKKKSRLLQEVEVKKKLLEEIKENIKLSELWRRKEKDEEMKADEKALLERNIMDEQQKVKEYKEKNCLFEQYKEEMNELKSLEDNLESQLISLRKDLNLNIQRENTFTNDIKNLCNSEPLEFKNIQDADNESLSQMSTTPDADLLETPNRDVPSMEEEIKLKYIDNKQDEIKVGECQNNNNNDDCSTAKLHNVITLDSDFKNSNVTNTRGKTLKEDTLNSNVFHSYTNTVRGEQNLKYCDNYLAAECEESLDKTGIMATEILDTLGILNSNSSGKRKKNSLLGQEKSTAIQNEKVFCESRRDIESNQGDIKEKIYSLKGRKELSYNVEEKNQEVTHDVENGNIEDVEKYSEKFGMRKSRSESSSLKDSNFSMKKNKELNRFSLYDFHDAPVLIDKVCENEESPEECNGSQVTLLNEELRESISKAINSSVQSYSQKLSFGREDSTIVGSPFMNINQGKKDATCEALKESEGFLQSNHLSFSPVYIARGLSEHLKVQSKLVNCALLSHFLVERKLLEHFLALKSFLLLNDASFARALIQNLIYKFPSGRPSPSFLSPVELNGILNDTIVASSSFQSPFASNLFFIVTDMSSNSLSNPLEIIDLRYNVSWPLCIILDDAILSMYSTVSKFLIRLHEVMLIIEDSFRHLTALKSRLEGKMSFHFHQINLFRHELQHLIRVLFGYITYQAIEGSWNSFQRNIRENVSTLDELYDSHYHFILEVSEKCFLTPNSIFTRNIIQEIFAEVILFHNVVKTSTWTHDWKNNKFSFIQNRISRFRDLSSLLNKNLMNLLQFSQQNHIEDFVFHLNYNENFQYR